MRTELIKMLESRKEEMIQIRRYSNECGKWLWNHCDH